MPGGRKKVKSVGPVSVVGGVVLVMLGASKNKKNYLPPTVVNRYGHLEYPSPTSSRNREEDTKRSKYKYIDRMTGEKSSSLNSFIAGGIAGVTAKSAVAPLERVKILYQIRSQVYSLDSIAGSLGKIWKNEGVKGLWRGNTATIARVFPYAAVQFLTFDTIKRKLASDKFSAYNMFIAGSAAGGVAVIATYPLDLLRARLAIEVSAKHTKPLDLFRSTFTNEGFRGIYRGIQPTLIGILPYGGISFMTFESLKSMAPYNAYKENGELTATYKLFAGGAAGGVAQTVSYPLDVVRRRMQTHGYGDGKVEIDLKRGSLMSVYRIFRNEGIMSLYRGLSINYIKVIPTSAIAFYTYEFCTQLFNRI
ncbi:mitochondrial substrate carrier family protein [Cavenderia fasciculata]|uniref:Mitochondrial substrate carrier family protein n=1 Tax=Cavenderia fasciculata TaxID=261658 RepID=F4PV31_CACFS|nr:mitochondrial substrate carrier family protein [Cavenderia fasciculata]EGG21147.1 mitochondrial substrate carrier family protein [Cavenderia fasciculata]|eukprot:XP_004358997.1 mitochondrial substrate carrier family protein [Cavenderia fasciculata]